MVGNIQNRIIEQNNVQNKNTTCGLRDGDNVFTALFYE